MTTNNETPSVEKQATEELAKAIERLPADMRAVFVRRFVQRKPLAEAASAVGISRDAAEVLATKGLAILRRRMAVHLNIGSPAETTHFRETLKKAGVKQEHIDRVAGGKTDDRGR